MGELCYFDEQPHPYESEPGPTECYGCGASEGSLSIYNSLTGLAWCCTACRERRPCDCIEQEAVLGG